MIKIIENKAQFDEEIAKNKTVFVDFFATWCSPCKMLGQVMVEFDQNHPEVTILKVDVDKLPEIASLFAVYSIPQVNIFVDGKEKTSFVGFRGIDDLENILATL